MLSFVKNKWGGFDYQTKKYLVEKYLKPEKIKGNLTKETYLAGEVLKKYPNVNFWRHFDLGFKLNSLAFFKTSDGEMLVSDAFSQFSFDLKPQTSYIPLQEKDFSVTLPEIQSKPKNIRDFLKS